MSTTKEKEKDSKEKEKDSKELRLLVKVDMPVKELVMNVAKTTTYGELRALIGKEFDIKDVDRYLFLSVALGKDVIELGKGTKGDKELLTDTGVIDSSVIFARAPSDIKPARPRPKKKKGKEGKEEKSVSADKDRYKGITAKNVFQKLSETKDSKKKKILLEYIDIYASDIFKNKSAINSLPKETFLDIIKSDRLNCKEGEVFDAVVSWSKNAIKEKKEDEKKNYGRTSSSRSFSQYDNTRHCRFGISKWSVRCKSNIRFIYISWYERKWR